MADSGQPSENLRCKLCSDRYTDPKLLPCLHTFCAACLDDLIEPVNGESSLAVTCPSCNAETRLSDDGIAGLPSNIFVNNLLKVVELPDDGSDGDGGHRRACNLCTEGIVAISRCADCLVFLCEFCEQAHRRQRRTARHRLMSLDESRGDVSGSSGSPSSPAAAAATTAPQLCRAHAGERLSLYCDSCDRMMCPDCALSEHRDHRYTSLADACIRHGETLARLFREARSHVSDLQEGLAVVRDMDRRVKERAANVAAEICKVVDAGVQALHEQKRVLLAALNSLQQQKLSVLECQQAMLERAIDDANASCQFAAEALRDGGETELLVMKGPLTRRLEELTQLSVPCKPQADDHIQFYSSEILSVLGCDEAVGVVEGQGTDPSNCVLMTEESVLQAKLLKPEVVTLVVRDRYGERRSRGGDSVKGYLESRKCNSIPCNVVDCEDGTYTIEFTASESGEHRLNVAIDDQHVHGSPFLVHVLPKRRRHMGVWHCCMFCSSGGKRNVRCGCGAAMPGGFLGCGHGHPGHPGRKHWSCCGNVVQKSDCMLEH